MPKATGKNVLRRILKKRSEPVASVMKANAPVREGPGGGQLQRSIGHGTKLSRRQRALHKKWGSSTAVEYFIGAGPLPQAHMEEFGGGNNTARPYARPAWDGGKMQMLDGFRDDLWLEISKSANRLARKRARAAAKAAGG
ncbi:hypothetical protein ATO13_23211 [Stappia sp. 22II-S9-Z10]|nr:hypothetical protein ATO13_23211 [Stappia sp. 22II-S9-Z10]